MTEAKRLSTTKMIKLSQQFTSYLEKHRIFELFQELSTMLLIKRPEDHILFLKQSLCHAARRLDVPRIIIFASPEFDILELAKILENKLNIPTITLSDIIDNIDDVSTIDSNVIVEKLRMILINYMKNNCDGWIYLNFPRTDKDARSLQRSGIIPTHVIDIISSDTRSKSSKSMNNTINIDYYKEIQALRCTFSNFIMKINVGKKKIEDIAEECLNVVKQRNYFRGKIKFRILLIDSIDSKRCKCLGQYISKIFNIIHIDFHEVLEKVSLCDTELGDKLRKLKKETNLKDLPAKIKIQIFEHFILTSECLKNGWVLTEFITTVQDFKELDMTDTSPNRVLIIVPKNYQKDSDNLMSNTECPDKIKKIDSNSEEKQVFISNEILRDIITYARESANIITDYDDLKVIKEKIEIILMAPPPCVPPRMPRHSSMIKFEDIEFDPDDEPTTDIFNNIRQPEPTLNLL